MNIYKRHRFPSEIISYAIWAYYRFSMSLRDVEDLLAERGVVVSYESVRRWCLKFGPRYRKALKRREGRLGDNWYVDEVFIKIGGQLHLTTPARHFRPNRERPGAKQAMICGGNR